MSCRKTKLTSHWMLLVHRSHEVQFSSFKGSSNWRFAYLVLSLQARVFSHGHLSICFTIQSMNELWAIWKLDNRTIFYKVSSEWARPPSPSSGYHMEHPGLTTKPWLGMSFLNSGSPGQHSHNREGWPMIIRIDWTDPRPYTHEKGQSQS